MGNTSDSGTAIGSWTGGDFEGTVARYAGIGDDTDISDESRFVSGVVQLLIKRTAELDARGESENTDIAIFVLRSIPPDSVSEARRVPMFDNGRTVVVGRLWFTSAPVASAKYVSLPADDDDDARFSFVTDELELGSQPTLIFDPRTSTPELRWYPYGLGQADNYELMPLSGNVNPQDVFEAIDHLYRECFVTPGSLPLVQLLWQEPDRHWPNRLAEKMLQSHLKSGLVLRFPYCKVRHEQTQTSGRTDLEIEQPHHPDRSTVTRHGIMELKVLSSYGSTGSTVSDVESERKIVEGVQQAAAYRNDKESRWTSLCCFDMREVNIGDSQCFAHVREFADDQAVELRRWFIYANSALYREANVPVNLHSSGQ